ncbi:hypothetical protein [Methylocystis parvus]|uniref:Uncharacterized protein n=1 Tax=Methylocystis parvus TaxID=134 RepID=A0A6B8MHA0_9HYPH|nr:hypothetical protein [Methylocystis parvus]QGN00031.1 hypothetical protein F7D14_20795 [Methylocystis parvus]WBK02471.1 hypothetical protein MMG94_21845 [Methylocystis parvus OBBP]
MGREEQLLSASIAETLGRAREAETKLGDLIESSGGNEKLLENDEMYEAEETLRFYLQRLYREVSILAERLKLPLFTAEIAAEFRSYEPNGLINMVHEPWDVGLISPALAKVGGLYQSLATMTDRRAVTGIDVFRTILQNTGAIIQAKGLEPRKESDVQQAIFEVVKFAFHDAIREIPVGQLLKTYKPDIGVRSLMAAAEYKFADSEKDVKKALDELYADMKGYSGHYDWRTFFAVIYTTDALLHQERLEEEFRGVKANMNWVPIIVTGKGRRVKRDP